MSDLLNKTNGELMVLVIDLRDENKDLHDADKKNTDMILNLTDQVEQFQLERVELKIAVKNLALYLQVQAG